MDDVAECWIDEIFCRDAEERDEFLRIGKIFRWKCCESVNLIGNQMNLVLLAEAHVFDHHFARVASTITMTLSSGDTVQGDYAGYRGLIHAD